MKIGVILSGCGFLDGAEIHESVLTLLAIDRLGHEYLCMAPDADQRQVVDHRTRQAARGERRNILAESARIARCEIRDLKGVKASEVDALILPGGFGAATNLTSFATEGAGCSILPEVERLLTEVHGAGKPIGAICIAPAVLARAFHGRKSVSLTIGNDAGTAAALQKLGATHRDCPVRECHVDRQNRVVTTPAYMLARRISEAAEGIEKLVREVAALARQPAAPASAGAPAR
ncbi:MAG: isoprenoid biosynthesis glyoxalase ElbB [Planctomycetes bacterium]|nr:isoprenoid biosynthesis glyoxalase ElbB [Planctomycetota bacterium]